MTIVLRNRQVREKQWNNSVLWFEPLSLCHKEWALNFNGINLKHCGFINFIDLTISLKSRHSSMAALKQ